MSKGKPMVSAGNSPQVRYSATYPTGARAYRESDSFAMWAVHHGVTVSMTTVSISSDPLIPYCIDPIVFDPIVFDPIVF